MGSATFHLLCVGRLRGNVTCFHSLILPLIFSWLILASCGLTEQVGVAVIIYTFILDVPISNLTRNTGFSHRNFRSFF